MRPSFRITLLAGVALFAAAGGAAAQDGHVDAHAGHGSPAAPIPQDAHAGHGAPAAPDDAHAGHDTATAEAHGGHGGLYGPYSMSREASGTAWVPDAMPMDGVHFEAGGWTGMVHGQLDLVYDRQGGPRGDDKTFSESMLMVMARRQAGPGVLGLRGMFSLDPLMGRRGYPLLFQTGETAGGEPLIDRQHPHDFLGELAVTYSVPVGEGASVFGYLGYPGEPAIGPAAYIHRFSGMVSPEAPIGHHWLDSTHVTFGVATAGVTAGRFKLEGSVFTGQEPDEDRWDFDEPTFDSQSVRLSFNPTPNWSLQVSRAELEEPEAHDPGVDVTRTTASAIWHRRFGTTEAGATLAWGRNDKNPGLTTDAWLLEGAVRLADRHTLFARAERADKDELFADHHDEDHAAPNPLAHRSFEVGKLSAGYVYELPVHRFVRFGIGGLVSGYDIPAELEPVYGDSPTSHMLFARLRIAQ